MACIIAEHARIVVSKKAWPLSASARCAVNSLRSCPELKTGPSLVSTMADNNDLGWRAVLCASLVLSIFAVNFRHVLYSAAIGRHLAHWPLLQQAIGYFILTDPQYAIAESKVESGRKADRPSAPFGTGTSSRPISVGTSHPSGS